MVDEALQWGKKQLYSNIIETLKTGRWVLMYLTVAIIQPKLGNHVACLLHIYIYLSLILAVSDHKYIYTDKMTLFEVIYDI